MYNWFMLVVLLSGIGCAIHPDPASEPRTQSKDGEAQPPPAVEKTLPPPPPSTTCPPAMRGSC